MFAHGLLRLCDLFRAVLHLFILLAVMVEIIHIKTLFTVYLLAVNSNRRELE